MTEKEKRDRGDLYNINNDPVLLEELLILFRNAGFVAVKTHLKEGKDWICVEGIR